MNKLFRISFKRFFALGFAVIFFLNFFIFTAVSEFEDRPDLQITFVDFPDEIIEDEEAKFSVKIKNAKNSETGEYGNISSGEHILVSLKVDNVRVSTKSYNSGLDVDEEVYVNLTWTADLTANSERQILIEVDYTQDIFESNENNNERPGLINVYEKDSELSITDVDLPDIFVVDNSYEIYASVKNSGAETNKDIIGFLNSSIDGIIKKVIFEDALERNQTHVFSFNWTPNTLGKHTLNIDIVYGNKTHDSYSSSVFVGTLAWWNSSWHYRYFISLTGEGNFSKTFNFTSLLDELGISNEYFENETIRIVHYSSDGDIINDSVAYKFNESSDYNPINNAKGTLLWDVEGSSNEKFYCIYFDVNSNGGHRSSLIEDESMNESGDATVKDADFVEGWDFKIEKPLEGSYVFVNDVVEISVNTDAIAENVEVFVFLNENESNNKTIYLETIDGVLWTNNTIFSILGNWTFRVKCWDDADYVPIEKEHTIFVGKPDLEFSDVVIKTSWPPTSPKVYINDTVDFTASVYCYFATVELANVTMTIYNNESVEIYSATKNSSFEKNKYTNVSFEWTALLGGNYTFKFFVDSDDFVDEINESNNELEFNDTVYYWPDLTVTSIKWKKTNIIEYDRIKFDVKVKNIGLGDAKDYDLKLFIQPSSQKTVNYENEIYTKKISVNSGSQKDFSLFWNSSDPGKWFVAAKVFVTDAKKDADISNNGLLVSDELVVRPTERVKPVIENVFAKPSEQEQAAPVEIVAYVTDDTGLESVFVSIYDSDENLIEKSDMIRIAGDGFNHIFTNTMKVDTYTFNITAIDISVNKNTKYYKGSFEIIPDQSPPSVSYVWADPAIQLIDKNVVFSCNAEDNVAIDNVKLSIIYPSGNAVRYMMQEKSVQYTYEDRYNESGNYSYYVIVTDETGNIRVSKSQYFYITSSLDDTDDDKMPDWWEERYGFNPFDSTDGIKDSDKDGLTNAEEYNGGTHPHKDIMLQNVAYRVRTNVLYIVFSISMFVILLLLNFIMRKRR